MNANLVYMTVTHMPGVLTHTDHMSAAVDLDGEGLADRMSGLMDEIAMVTESRLSICQTHL